LNTSLRPQKPLAFNYIKSKDSPKNCYAIGMIDTSSPLMEYEKCYLSGLSKYYKGAVGSRARR